MLRKLKEAGVVGGGGAGFPTWKKLDAKAETIILNAAECEPILETDKYYLRYFTKEVLLGLSMSAKQVGSSDIAIVLKETYTREIAALENTIAQLGLSVRLVKARPIYPAGDEQVAVFEATGKIVPPASIPLEVGCVVISVTTACNIYLACENNQPITHRMITVYGEVASPRILNCPVGTSVGDCIKDAGGVTIDDYKIILGGPMMGKLLKDDNPLSHSICRMDSGVFVVPTNHYLVDKMQLTTEYIKNRAASVCIQCQFCSELCPRYLLGHEMYPHKVMRALALGENLEAAKSASLCCECGVCELYSCPMGLSPRAVNVIMKPLLKDAGISPNKNLVEYQQTLRQYRQIPASRLSARIDVARYAIPDPDTAYTLYPDIVTVLTKQHIGAPALPTVLVGDTVTEGQTIASMSIDALGSDIHASISGVVTDVLNSSITIKRH